MSGGCDERAEALRAVARPRRSADAGDKSLVSILIVNWNTRERVIQCLASLPNDVPGLSCEVIVVDNGSVDGSAEALGRQPEITLIRNERNLGYAAAVNQAYRRSSGEFVLLLNSDVDTDARRAQLSRRSSSSIIRPRPASGRCT